MQRRRMQQMDPHSAGHVRTCTILDFLNLNFFNCMSLACFKRTDGGSRVKNSARFIPAYDVIRSTLSEHRALLCERLEQANMNYTTGII